MKNKFVLSVCAVCAAVVLASLFAPFTVKEDVSYTKKEAKGPTLEMKLTDMLNHNFVYGSDFDNADDLVSSSLNALVRFKENGGDYIKKTYVADFVNDMYGVKIADLTVLNTSAPELDGYVFVESTGAVTYKHKDIKLTKNEDGTISAETTVTINGFDNNKQTYKANSLFLESDDSAFGYNIIYSEIIPDSPAM